MSRIAKKPIEIPNGVTFVVSEGNYEVKGPKGELIMKKVPMVMIDQKDNQIITSIKDEENGEQKAFWGTATRVIQNMLIGVSEGFVKKLEINGVGYKAEMKGKELELNVGYSHSILFPETSGVSIQVEKNIITISGIDKVLVGQVAANIRKIRKPEPYKGKGIKYIDEVIRRKEGKQVKAGS